MRDNINYLSLLVFITCFLTANYTEAQSLSKIIIASNGDNYKSESITLDWTIGELAVSSYTSETGAVSEGFHAGNNQSELSTRILELESVSKISISPNPSSGIFRIPLEVRLHKRNEIQIYSNTGVLIDSRSPLENNLVDISGLQSGIYYLIIAEPDNTGSVAKLIKI